MVKNRKLGRKNKNGSSYPDKRCYYRDFAGRYLIGDLSDILENPRLTDKRIGNGTHIFELAQ